MTVEDGGVGPTVLVFDRLLTSEQFDNVVALLENAKQLRPRALVLDFGDVEAVDAMVAAAIVLFIQRRLRRHERIVAIPPRQHADWFRSLRTTAALPLYEERSKALDALSNDETSEQSP